MSLINTAAIPAVEFTLYGLLGFSVVTWTLILIKSVQHWKIRRQNSRFNKAFWGAANFQAASQLDLGEGPLPRITQNAFVALQDKGAQATDLEHSWDRQDLLERSLRQHIQKERRALESGLAVLASIGSTAPFVGLFGTVWGIMNALTSISKLGVASLEVVAGPIGEALIATGIGIAVAVPAVLAYNYFIRKLKLISADMDDFAHDFINLAQRSSFRVAAPARVNTSTEANSAVSVKVTKEVFV